MPQIAKVLSSRLLQSQVRRHLDGCPSFRVPETLPDELREKLERLDRAVAEKSKP